VQTAITATRLNAFGKLILAAMLAISAAALLVLAQPARDAAQPTRQAAQPLDAVPSARGAGQAILDAQQTATNAGPPALGIRRPTSAAAEPASHARRPTSDAAEPAPGAAQRAISAAATGRTWVGSWASSQQAPEARNVLSAEDLTDATLRQIVHLSLGGETLRVRFSNVFGMEPLYIPAVHIAKPRSPGVAAIVAATDAPLTFNGEPSVTIPAGAEYLSDPIAFLVPPQSNLAITLYFERPPAQQTSHPGARTDSFLVHGNKLSASELPSAKRFRHWFQISGVDVLVPEDENVDDQHERAAAIAILGDSITDGRGSTPNGNDRWPDLFAQRLHEKLPHRSLGVLNLGVGGGRILNDGIGPNALARFDRDVLAQTGVRYLILFEGINDIGTFDPGGTKPQAAHDTLVRNLIGGLAQIVERAHAAGIKVYGATLTPFVGTEAYDPKPINEADRAAVNAWIRAPGHFDAVLDFDAVLRDPARPDRLAAAFDSGDHLHPSPAGYAAVAASIPLALFE
jgi:lysophospholipase L1-like esterase